MTRLTIFMLLVVAVAAPAFAGQMFYATLAPPPGSASTASGSATLELSDDLTTLSYHISFTGLSSPEIGAHIHKPDGNVAYTLPPGSPKIGAWVNPGFAIISFLQLGQLYIVIHTEANGGELNGTITDEPTPTQVTTWGRIKSLY
jgi:hypothetical protein